MIFLRSLRYQILGKSFQRELRLDMRKDGRKMKVIGAFGTSGNKHKNSVSGNHNRARKVFFYHGYYS